MFKELHPDRGYVSVYSEAVTIGRNAEDTAYKDNRYVRCRKCGFINHQTEIHAGEGSRAGEGNTQASTQLNGSVSTSAATITVDSTASFAAPASGSITAFSAIRSVKVSGSLTVYIGTRVTSASHGLKGGEVTISGTTNYNGTFRIVDVATDTFDIGKSYVVNDAAGTWYQPEYIYIYDTGTYSTSEDADSTYTAATGGPRMDKVSYTGLTSTTFTGCSGTLAHDDNMYVRGERIASSGCRLCGTYLYY